MKKAAAAPFYYYSSTSPILSLASSSSSSPSSSVLLLLFLLLGCSILLFFPLDVSCGDLPKPPPSSTQQDAFHPGHGTVSDASSVSEESTQSSSAADRGQQQQQSYEWNQQQSTNKYMWPCPSICSSEAGECCDNHSTADLPSIHPSSEPRIIQLPTVGPYTVPPPETQQRPTAKKKRDGHANAAENLRKGGEKGKRGFYAKEEDTDYSSSVVEKMLTEALNRREVAAKGFINKDEIEDNSSKNAKERKGGGGGDLPARYNLQQELLISPSLRKHLPHAASREAADVAASTSGDEDITAAVTSRKNKSSWEFQQFLNCLPSTKANLLDFARRQAGEADKRKAAPQDQAAAAAAARAEAAVREGGAAAAGRAEAGAAASGKDVRRRFPEASPLEQFMGPRQQVLTPEAELGARAIRRRVVKKQGEAGAAAAASPRHDDDRVKRRPPTARKGPLAKLRENVWLQEEFRDLFLPVKGETQTDTSSSREVLLMQDMKTVPQRSGGGGSGGRGGAVSPVMVVDKKNHNKYGGEGGRGRPRPTGLLIHEALSRDYQRVHSSAVQHQPPRPQERGLRHYGLPHGRKEQQNKDDIGEWGKGRYTTQSPARRGAHHVLHHPSHISLVSVSPSSSDNGSSNSSSYSMSTSEDSFSTAGSRTRYTLHEKHRDGGSDDAGHEGMQAKKGQKDAYPEERIEKHHHHHYVKPKKDREYKAAAGDELLTVGDKQREYDEQKERGKLKEKKKKVYRARRYHHLGDQQPALGGGVLDLDEYAPHPLTRITPQVTPPPLTRRKDYQQGGRGDGDGAVKVGVPGGEYKGMLDTSGIRRAAEFLHPPKVRHHLPHARLYDQVRPAEQVHDSNLATPPIPRNLGGAAADAQLKVSPPYQIPLADDPASGAIRKEQHAGNVAGNKQPAEGAAAHFSKGSGAAAGADNSSSSGRHALDGKFLVSTAKERLEKELGVRKGLERPDAVNAAWQALKAMAVTTGDQTRMLYLRLRRKLPWSWSRFIRDLPTVDDDVILEFRAVRQHLKRHRSQVLIISTPSPALRHLIGTKKPDATLQHGVVVKARVIDRNRPAKGASEINGLLNVVPQSTFMLSAYGAWVSSPEVRSAGSLIEAKCEKIGNKGGACAKNDPSPKGERPHVFHRKRWRGKKRAEAQTILYVVTPRARGDLDDYIRKGKHPINIQLTAAQMVYAVNLLHSAGFIHRDIKLMNFFVSFDGHVQLADFDGLWPSGIPVPTREFLLYTRGYLAPEVDINETLAYYTVKSDIYALGICYKELLEAGRKTENTALLKDLYKSMTAMNPEQRPTASEAMEHAYFKNIDFSTLEKLNYPVPLPGPFLIGPGFYS